MDVQAINPQQLQHHRRYRSRAIWDETRRPDAPFSTYIHAILYEVQPIRFSTISLSFPNHFLKNCLSFLISIFQDLFSLITKRKWTLREVMTICFVLGYGYAVRYLHRAFDAGPMFLILTALIAIFTIGLGENNSGISAYSVFNRGFRQILGSIDVESLVNQYVGGGFAPQQPPQHQQEEDEDEVVAIPQQQRENNNTSRRSGKKARRKNLEQRRELQRQRRAAEEMGLDPALYDDILGDGIEVQEAGNNG